MDDLTQKLQALLSDPESMRDLSELAAMLREPDSQTAAPPAEDAPTAPSAPDPPQMDFTKILAVGQALSAVQNLSLIHI